MCVVIEGDQNPLTGIFHHIENKTLTAKPEHQKRKFMAMVKQLKEALAKELARIEKKSVVSRAGDDRPSYDRVLKILQQLDKLPVDLTILQDTFVGIVVSKLKKNPDDVVAKTARRLLKKWKRAIKEEETASTAAPARGENNIIRRNQPPPQKQRTHEKHQDI